MSTISLYACTIMHYMYFEVCVFKFLKLQIKKESKMPMNGTSRF
jgi:hypothetical protein